MSILDEFKSKELLKSYSIPVTREVVVMSLDEALSAAVELGYPVVLKGLGVAHKSEQGLVRLNIGDEQALRQIYAELDCEAVLVQEQISGQRELVAGLIRDAQFGPCVMFGLGGIYTEALSDVTFRVAPLCRDDAYEMLEEVRCAKLLGEFRGQPAVDREQLADILVSLGRIGMDDERVQEIDINPLIVSGSTAVAVDALVVLED